MSIRERLEAAIDRGQLIRYPFASLPEKRELYLSAPFYRELRNETSAMAFFGQRIAVATMFERWLAGSDMAVRIEGNVEQADMARLIPPPEEIWEMRITKPVPQLRIFGRFAAIDQFVALSACNRDRLGRAFSASGKRSHIWQEVMYECETLWNGIFGGAQPFRGQCAADYISENIRRPHQSA